MFRVIQVVKRLLLKLSIEVVVILHLTKATAIKVGFMMLFVVFAEILIEVITAMLTIMKVG